MEYVVEEEEEDDEDDENEEDEEDEGEDEEDAAPAPRLGVSLVANWISSSVTCFRAIDAAV